MVRVLACLVFLAPQSYGEDLRVDYTRQSLIASHIHYQQYLDGLPVIGGERIESVSRDGRREVADHLARPPVSAFAVVPAAPAGGDQVYLNVDGDARLASRVIVEDQPHRRYANYYDAATGAL